MASLTQKETELLKDLRAQEQLCIDKYTKHSAEAKDPQLKNLFTEIAQIERKHLQTIDEIAAGQTPATGGAGQSAPKFQPQSHPMTPGDKQADTYLCADVLASEKHASGLYDTSIFEFSDVALRNVLNHIQKEEQEHGQMISAYMQANQMYC